MILSHLYIVPIWKEDESPQLAKSLTQNVRWQEIVEVCLEHQHQRIQLRLVCIATTCQDQGLNNHLFSPNEPGRLVVYAVVSKPLVWDYCVFGDGTTWPSFCTSLSCIFGAFFLVPGLISQHLSVLKCW